jgi:hypothetical protein
MIIASVAVIPGCRRAPEEPPEATPVVDVGPRPVLTVLELPQHNPELGFGLSSAPPGLVATFNEGASLEITDERRPALRYTFAADLPGSPSRSPSSVAAFETFIGKHNDGRLVDSGSLETALGPSTWADGTYFEEETSFSDLRVFAPHPSGSGTLVLSAVCPSSEATVEERLAVIRQLLAEVS